MERNNSQIARTLLRFLGPATRPCYIDKHKQMNKNKSKTRTLPRFLGPATRPCFTD